MKLYIILIIYAFSTIVIAAENTTSKTKTKVVVSGDAALGKIKSTICAGCHGLTGNSLSAAFPKIAGQGESYLYKQLKDFKNGLRKDPTMLAMVVNLSDGDMKNLSVYYAAQKTSSNVAHATKIQLALGKKIYQGGKKKTKTTACLACHGPYGRGIPSAGFPKIASQQAAYIAKQLFALRQVSFNEQTNSKTASRSNDLSGMMQSVASELTNDEIEALAQYIAGLN